MRFTLKASASILAASIAMSATAAHAQDTETSEDAASSGNVIVVTARKREESLLGADPFWFRDKITRLADEVVISQAGEFTYQELDRFTPAN